MIKCYREEKSFLMAFFFFGLEINQERERRDRLEKDWLLIFVDFLYLHGYSMLLINSYNYKSRYIYIYNSSL